MQYRFTVIYETLSTWEAGKDIRSSHGPNEDPPANLVWTWETQEHFETIVDAPRVIQKSIGKHFLDT